MSDPILQISGLEVAVDGTPILRGVDLAIPQGEVHALMGPNGSGESEGLARNSAKRWRFWQFPWLLKAPKTCASWHWTARPPPFPRLSWRMAGTSPAIRRCCWNSCST